MNTIIKILLPLFIILTAFSCVDNNEVKKEIEKESATLTVCYDETKAADPWSNRLNLYWPTLSDSSLISYAKNYLLVDSINVYDISVNHDGQFHACNSSFCTTGRRVKVLIDRTDLIKIQKIRFYECK